MDNKLFENLLITKKTKSGRLLTSKLFIVADPLIKFKLTNNYSVKNKNFNYKNNIILNTSNPILFGLPLNANKQIKLNNNQKIYNKNLYQNHFKHNVKRLQPSKPPELSDNEISDSNIIIPQYLLDKIPKITVLK